MYASSIPAAELVAVAGPSDHYEPVITVMLLEDE
jgi:hypothetical protein